MYAIQCGAQGRGRAICLQAHRAARGKWYVIFNDISWQSVGFLFQHSLFHHYFLLSFLSLSLFLFRFVSLFVSFLPLYLIATGCVSGRHNASLHDTRFTTITYSWGDGLLTSATRYSLTLLYHSLHSHSLLFTHSLTYSSATRCLATLFQHYFSLVLRSVHG